MSKRRKPPSFAELAATLEGRLRPPFGIVLGSPNEVLDLASVLPSGDATCFQMDLHQAARVRESLKGLGLQANVETRPDLWDLPEPVQTLLYPVPLGGERALKLDMIEQAYHTLRPQGTFVVLSPYERDEFFPLALKKVFGKVHAPMGPKNSVFWCQRDGDRPRRRHEIVYQVRGDGDTSYRFVSRPGVFSYGKLDEGARALIETMEVNAGDRVLDLGCGVGAIGIFAAKRAGSAGFATLADSNVRALALTDINARAAGLTNFETLATSTLTELPKASYDLVVANPPYYAQLTIAARFINQARDTLKPGGRFCLVTKQPDTLYPVVEEMFGEPQAFERRGYVIFRAEK